MGICKRELSKAVYYDEAKFTWRIAENLDLPLVTLPAGTTQIDDVVDYIINVTPNCRLVIDPLSNRITVVPVSFMIHSMLVLSTLPNPPGTRFFADFVPVTGNEIPLDLSLAKQRTEFDFPDQVQQNAVCEIVEIVPHPSFTVIAPNQVSITLDIDFKVLIVVNEESMVQLCNKDINVLM